MFSNRSHWTAATNLLTRARETYPGKLLDLTVSNPTKAGIIYPLDELSEIMGRAARAPYDPKPLGLNQRWEIDIDRLRGALTGRTRCILVVNPNNPTGSYVSAPEQDQIAGLGTPVISDEVFHPFAFGEGGPSFVRDDVLTFTLGGLSKSAGLPHFKLGWIRVSGPGKAEATHALEWMATNFLSVATPVQVALPEILA